MQTSKYLLGVGVLAAVILPLQLSGAPDTEDQAKLREAMRRALEQSLPATGSRPAAAPAPVQPAKATPPPEPVVAPVAPPPPQTRTAPVATPAVTVQTAQPVFESVPPPDDAASLARAREAMREKMKQLETAPASTTPAAQPVFTPASATPAAQPVFTPVAAVTPTPGHATPTAQPVAFGFSGYTPIEAPASPLSATKQAELESLLARYRSDAITAQDYHAQRAAIIAAP